MQESELRQQLTEAMRRRDALQTKVLRGVLAGLKNKAIESRGTELREADVTTILKREVKQCGETLEFARKSGRRELIEEAEATLAILQGLLPAQLSEAELRTVIRDIVRETGATSIGPVMKTLGERHAGLYDGKIASQIARELVAVSA